MTTPKLKTGVNGLDEIFLGGILEGESVLVEGLPGTGKTTLGLHFILQGIQDGQPGLIITFEEFPAQYYRDALNFGWDLRALERAGSLRIIITSPDVLQSEMEKPDGMFDQMTRELGVKRVLVDSINFLHKIKRETIHQRDLINRFINGFKRQSISSFLIKDVEGDDLTHWGMYSVDCYIRLSFDLVRSQQRRRFIEVFKARGQQHLYGQHPFAITQRGVEVYPAYLADDASVKTRVFPDRRRIRTGISGLDDMLGGGLFEGQGVLLAGSSGTGKTNVAMHFLALGLEQKEHCLYVSLEQQIEHFLPHAKSLGFDFASPLEEGCLTLLTVSPDSMNEGEFLARLRKLLRESSPKRLVIDPVSFLQTISPSAEIAQGSLQTLIRILREANVTSLLTSEIPEMVGEFRLGDSNLSYLVDTILLMRLAEIEASIRKVIMVIKHRGSAHDRNLRELQVTSRGVRIGEPFLSHEGILTGMTRRRSGAEPQKILIVDDDPRMIELIRASIRDERYTLQDCGDGETALRLAMTELPDLILLDLMLPKLNGFEVCQRLKADPATAEIPVIMLSAKGETEVKVEGINLGMDDYITKPFSPQELVARVKMILRRSQQMKKSAI